MPTVSLSQGKARVRWAPLASAWVHRTRTLEPAVWCAFALVAAVVQLPQKLMARYQAAHLLIFRNAELDPVVDESRFLQGLAVGQSPPWLGLAGFNRDTYVYRVEISPGSSRDPRFLVF